MKIYEIDGLNGVLIEMLRFNEDMMIFNEGILQRVLHIESKLNISHEETEQ